MGTTDGDGDPEARNERPKASRIILIILGGTILAVLALLIPSLIESGYVTPNIYLVLALAILVAGATLLQQHPDFLERGAKRIAFRVRRMRPGGRAGNGARYRMSPSLRPNSLKMMKATAVHFVIMTGFAAIAWPVTSWWTAPPLPDGKKPCGRALELRVLTSAENHDVIQRLADRFAIAPENNEGCRLAHLMVFARSSAHDVEQAFTQQWSGPSNVGSDSPVATLLGAHPDVWLPASSAEVDHIVEQRPKDAELDNMGSLAYSPFVFAAPKDYRQRIESHLEEPASSSWGELIDAARKSGLTVARPDPGLSVAGLLATADLYRGPRQAGKEALRALERGITSGGAPVSDLHDLLCSIRTTGASTTAVIVPEQAWLAYETGRPLGDDCPRPISRPPVGYHAFHPANAHGPDHPFVRVTWRKQTDRLRDVAIDRWKAWLEEHLAREGDYRDSAGRAQGDPPPVVESEVPVRVFAKDELSRTLEEFPNARPTVTLAFIVDRSRSMNKPTVTNVSRLDSARELVGESLKLLDAADSAGVWVFPKGRGPDDTRLRPLQGVVPFNAENRDDTAKKLSAFAADPAGHTPLYNAIEEAARGLQGKGLNQAVIVFTDGDNSVRGGIDAAGLSRRLRSLAHRPRVLVVAIGERECEEPDIKKLEQHHIMERCHSATSATTTQQLISEIFAGLRSGTK